jgi:hypothetical protein
MINKKLTYSVIACVLGVTFSTASLAAPSWDTCGIDRVGVTGASGKLVKVQSCGAAANNGIWLHIVSQPNASLSTLLTALGLAKKVKINADFALGSTTGLTTGPINTIYLDQ